jgi:hypothetical protein
VSPASGIGVIYNCAILHDGNVFAVTLAAWITTFFTLTLTTNFVYTSGSHLFDPPVSFTTNMPRSPHRLPFRIWFTMRKVASFPRQTLLPVVIVVVESGAIYLVSCITLLTVYLLGSNAQYPVLDWVSPFRVLFCDRAVLTPVQMFPLSALFST